MNNKIKEVIEFTISLTYSIHKLTLIYLSVFKSLIKEKEGEYYG